MSKPASIELRWTGPGGRGWNPDDWTLEELRAAGLADLENTYGDWELWAGTLRLGYVYQSQEGGWVGILAYRDPRMVASAATLEAAKAELEQRVTEEMPPEVWEDERCHGFISASEALERLRAARARLEKERQG